MQSPGLSPNRKVSFPNVKSSFASLNREELETHIAIGKYGSFLLTDAIRPSYDLRILPEEAYCKRTWRDSKSRFEIPVLAAMVSREKLSDVFFDLLTLLGSNVDAILESSHFRRNGHTDYTRNEIELPILQSILYDFEDVLLNDGYLGITVIDSSTPVEIRFDEHKTLSIFGRHTEKFEAVFRSYQIPLKENLRFLAEDEHIHASSPAYKTRLEEFRSALGIGFEFDPLF